MTHGWAVPYYQLQEENQDEGTGVQGAKASKEKLTRHKHRGVQDPGWKEFKKWPWKVSEAAPQSELGLIFDILSHTLMIHHRHDDPPPPGSPNPEQPHCWCVCRNCKLMPTLLEQHTITYIV
ncbi:hypothetical protein WMY93_032699 [Mugilogobius chulae]|uniref:Uncharacterized protein n=1 Tax=Mugilogobius chulae TaxID=88201 RepID=A0AAW0MQR2_9GOBI